MLDRLQRGLETMYRIDTDTKVGDFLIDELSRDEIGVNRAPREQLLLQDEGDEVAVGLFVHQEALSNLEANDPTHRLGNHNLGDFLLAVEGVSHFVYLMFCARKDQRLSALELELQAEIDKYVTCLLCGSEFGQPNQSPVLRRRLFEQFELHDDLDDEEVERYKIANQNAHRYSASLERRFVSSGRIPAMLGELRRFYRLPLDGKLDLIRAA